FAKFGAITNNSKNSNKFLIIVFAIIMPIVASIIQMAISREREYKADKGAALITKKPQHLASALMKLENYANSYRMRNASEQSAHMFIINPFSSMGDKLSQLFRTHPSTNDRIQALRKLQEEIN
ncbi:M48 family metalloprotease, partial [Campylobacter pinnipediorum]